MVDRTLVYPLQVPLETDILNANVDCMVGLGGILQMLLGGVTAVVGLGAAPVSPAGMSVTLAPGSITQAEEVDPTNAYSSLGTNTNPTMKMGMSYLPVTVPVTAPTTAGYSQAYLIQVEFAETDTAAVVLPYLNPANSLQALAGPGGNQATQNTRRLQQAVISVVAGAPAPTGSQATPAASVGCFGLYVVTVANGQTSIIQSNIAIANNAPFLNANLLTIRQRLTANLNLYVSSASGNDGNNGLSAINPFLTLQAAANSAINNFDTNGYSITINVADGTYSSGVNISRAPVGGGNINFLGDAANPGNCVINVVGQSCFYISAGFSNISGFKVQATGTVAGQGCGILSTGSASVLYNNMNFSNCAQYHVYAASGGNVICGTGSAITISGNAIAHLCASQGFVNLFGVAFTITQNVAFSYFALATLVGLIQCVNSTFGGSGLAGTTGARYSASVNAAIATNGGGANYFPGNAAGATGSGGTYA